MPATERINIRTTSHAKALIERQANVLACRSVALWLKVPTKKP